jgi:transaldolase
MKFFVDTADVQEIRELAATGLIDGVTTNPSLVAKTGRDFFEVVKEICSVVEGPVSAEVTALDADAMIEEGRTLAALAPNVAVKVPLTLPGLKACRTLTQAGTMVNVTLCFSANQALLAAKAGATFISPFIGRLDDIGHDGMQLIADIIEIYSNYESISTEVLVASVRSPAHVMQAARLGADVCTIPPAVIHQLARHTLTDKGLEAFLADWQKTGQTILNRG